VTLSDPQQLGTFLHAFSFIGKLVQFSRMLRFGSRPNNPHCWNTDRILTREESIDRLNAALISLTIIFYEVPTLSTETYGADLQYLVTRLELEDAWEKPFGEMVSDAIEFGRQRRKEGPPLYPES
jgi:hypothetical protein